MVKKPPKSSPAERAKWRRRRQRQKTGEIVVPITIRPEFVETLIMLGLKEVDSRSRAKLREYIEHVHADMIPREINRCR